MIPSKGQRCLLDNIEAMFYLAVVNLLAHNNIAIIYYVQENSQRLKSKVASKQVNTFGGTIYFAVDGTYMKYLIIKTRNWKV